MTETEATKRARSALRFGYFAMPTRDVWVKCPLCRDRVVLSGLMGREPSHGEMVKQLTARILECPECAA